ncbi:MAG: hypothetical protein IKP88_17720 [Lachnospiraceae bacterium]|nr:hypothetical protein [Lachnospiraceae bacterium]
MFGKYFELNEQTMHIVEEIGRHMPGGFFIYKASEPEELLYVNKAVLKIFGCETKGGKICLINFVRSRCTKLQVNLLRLQQEEFLQTW